LEQFDQVAGRVDEQDLAPAGAGDHGAAEGEAGVAEPGDLGIQVVDDEVDTVAASGGGVVGVARAPELAGSGQQEPKWAAYQVGEDPPLHCAEDALGYCCSSDNSSHEAQSHCSGRRQDAHDLTVALANLRYRRRSRLVSKVTAGGVIRPAGTYGPPPADQRTWAGAASPGCVGRRGEPQTSEGER
jgi:hypothetical protein